MPVFNSHALPCASGQALITNDLSFASACCEPQSLIWKHKAEPMVSEATIRVISSNFCDIFVIVSVVIVIVIVNE